MPSNQTTVQSDLSINPVIGQVLGAIAALIAGWKALEPRYARLRKFSRDGGRYNLALRLLYWVPQALNVGLMLLLICCLIFALFGGLDAAKLLPTSMLGPNNFIVGAARAVYGYGWVLVLAAAVFGVVVYLDVFAFVALWAARVINYLPGVSGRFGPNGDSLGWYQASELLSNQGNAQLFWIDEYGVERLAAAVFEKMAKEDAAGTDRAATPDKATTSERANIALIGCIIEQIETDLKKPTRKWDSFYAALAEAAESQKLFSPDTLVSHNAQTSFAERIRIGVNPVLASKGEQAIGIYIDEDVDAATQILRARFHGDASRLASGWRRHMFGQITALFQNARLFPRLAADKMRPQFVKLCIRWDVIPAAVPRVFLQPFSINIGWLELHYGALKPLSDQVAVNFNSPIDRPASVIVATTVMEEVLRRLNVSVSAATKALRDRYSKISEPKRSWLIRQEADTTMWRLARELVAEGRKCEWKGDDWQWKLNNAIATRV